MVCAVAATFLVQESASHRSVDRTEVHGKNTNHGQARVPASACSHTPVCQSAGNTHMARRGHAGDDMGSTLVNKSVGHAHARMHVLVQGCLLCTAPQGNTGVHLCWTRGSCAVLIQ